LYNFSLSNATFGFHLPWRLPRSGRSACFAGPRVEKGTFSPDQIRRLISAAQGDWKGLIISGFFTGARLSDLANLQWSNVDLAERTLTFRQRKTDAAVKIPIHPDLEDHLLKLPCPHKTTARTQCSQVSMENALPGQMV
jgi:integrase